MKSISILGTTILIALTSARGPHHPRGEKIVKRHVHYQPSKESDIIRDDQLIQDTAHLQEHLEGIISEPDFYNMTAEEIDFYYFSLHDTDVNGMLDGLEFMQAVLHVSHKHGSDDEEEEGHEEGENHEGDEDHNIDDELSIENISALIDKLLEDEDEDNDGYLSYPEFIASRASRQGRTQSIFLSKNTINQTS